MKVFSFKGKQEIEQLIAAHLENPGLRVAHRELAREVTTLVHGSQECQMAEMASKALFGQGELSGLDERTLTSALSQLPKITIPRDQAIPTWVDLIAATGVVDSKSAARRIVKEGGAYLNNVKVSEESFAPALSDFLYGKFLLLRKGKRDLAAVELE